MTRPVLAIEPGNNADLVLRLRKLGYLRDDWRILDPTYGRGRWWSKWTPTDLVAHDLKTDGVDFRALPHVDGEFDAITFDPPYKLNGTPSGEMDEAYGVDTPAGWQGRHALIRIGIDECARVLKPGGILIVKCQDQVCGGQVRWQTRVFADYAEMAHDLKLVDMLHVSSMREQPPGRRQEHARRNYSTALVFKKPKTTKKV